MKIVFFGTPDFAARTLRFLLENQIDIAAVVTKPDKPKGRSGKLIATAVKQVAEEYSIPCLQPEKASDPQFTPVIEKFHADLFVVVAYGEIIKQHLLDMPKLGCINVHGSLLPKYRGAAPIQHALINGEAESGITIQHMALKMDAGPVIKTASCTIGKHTNAAELHDLLCQLGSQALLDVIYDFKEGVISETPQDESQVTYAKKIELEDCEIDWSQPSISIHNLVRGVTPFPGAWTYVTVRGEKKRLKIQKTHPILGSEALPKKIICYDQNALTIGTGKGALNILQLQLEGKRSMSFKEFIQGVSIKEISL